MTALWQNDGEDWTLLSPVGFNDEATLHSLIEGAPQLLPLSGGPQLVMLGREVALGSGAADLLAVEPEGRPVLIEVKLAKNAEARRAIVAQILAYAAFLHGMTTVDLEALVASKLQARGYEGIAGAVADNYQEGPFDPNDFTSELHDSLEKGRFRLVLVLDQAPPELVRLVGYLGTMTAGVVIDLITVAAYDVNGSKVLVPQRVDAERQRFEPTSKPAATPKNKAVVVSGGQDFGESIESADPEHQPVLKQLFEWAKGLEQMGLVKLATAHGVSGVVTLAPKLKDIDAGLVTIANGAPKPALWLWRSVFEKRAPHAMEAVQELIAPLTIGTGTSVTDISEELLQALTAAYEEAAAPADVVIVAASGGYGEYQTYSAYLCQPKRGFRSGLTHMGFYADGEIKPEIARILVRRDGLITTVDEVKRLRAVGTKEDDMIAEIIERRLELEPQREGKPQQIFALTPPDSPQTLKLAHPIRNDAVDSTGKPTAWTQKQRYVRLELLKSGLATTSELTPRR